MKHVINFEELADYCSDVTIASSTGKRINIRNIIKHNGKIFSTFEVIVNDLKNCFFADTLQEAIEIYNNY